MDTLESVVLVTGGTGLVGRAIKSVVEQNKNETRKWVFIGSKDADLRNLAETQQLFEKYKPTHVIHLAAYVGGLFKNMRQKVEFWRYNAAMNDNVMLCCKDFKVAKLVSCLSTCIFPDKTTYPIDETMLHMGPPHQSNEGYAYAKRMIDVLNRCYAEEYGCKFTSVIPTNIYGKYDNFNLQDSHVIPGLIHKCYLAKKNNTDLVIFGSGQPVRQFIFSEDLARLMVWTLDNYDSVEPLILSVDPEDEVSIADVAMMIVESMDFRGKVVFDTSKADGQFKKTANNAKLRGLVPDLQFVPLRNGIRESVEWFVANYDTARV
eukprot:c8383_g1_i1.p1 GENE.c8383_g1_i1~~c8383_g1_i1.p1  ORF type:complete len:329 (-),score=87.83 c8383_g1_i1:266-1222(-)